MLTELASTVSLQIPKDRWTKVTSSQGKTKPSHQLLPYSFQLMSHFFQDVYEVVRMIPYGRVTSYAAIGHYLGQKNGARMVGWAMNACPSDVPAHRVVNSKGILSGSEKFKGNKSMECLLEEEGQIIHHHAIQNFDSVLWLPKLELL